MNRKLLIGIILAVLIVAAGGVSYVLVQTSSTDDEPPADETSEATPEQQPSPAEEPTEDETDDDEAAQREAMEELALEATEIMVTWDPRVDFNQTEAEMRAGDLMTDELEDSITAPERPATGTEWLDAAEAGATSQPEVEINRATSDEVISVMATWVWVTEDGDVVSNPEERRAYYFNFETVDGELLVSDYSYETLTR